MSSQVVKVTALHQGILKENSDILRVQGPPHRKYWLGGWRLDEVF